MEGQKLFDRVVTDFEALCKQPHPQVNYVGRAALLKHMKAVAEAARRSQQFSLLDTMRYVSGLQQAGAVRGLLFQMHVLFDETPLRLKVGFDNEGQVVESAKVVVIEVAWSILFKELYTQDANDPKNFVLVQGHWSPTTLCGDRETGECYAGMLQRAIPLPRDIGAQFKFNSKLWETDEAGANARAAQLWGCQFSGSLDIHLFCNLHKDTCCSSENISALPGHCPGYLTSVFGLATAWGALSALSGRFTKPSRRSSSMILSLPLLLFCLKPNHTGRACRNCSHPKATAVQWFFGPSWTEF